MEKCAKFIVDSNDQVTQALGEVPCLSDSLSVNGFNVGPYIIWGIILVVVILVLKKSIFTVKQQTFEVVERLGKFNKIAHAGLNFRIPFIDKIVGDGALNIQQLSMEVTAKSKDSSFVGIPVKIQLQVDVEKAKDSFYALANPGAQITAYVENVVRSKATTMTMEEIFENKNTFEEAVSTALSTKFSGFGYNIINILIDNPLPSKQVIDASNAVIASKRLKEAAENEAEAIKVKVVGQAKAEAESLILKAEAYNKQRTILTEFFEKLPGDARSYLIGMDYRDMVREASKGAGTVIIVPSVEAGNDIAKVVSGLKVN
jgi:regulator of protease activity HflC (stomatin/prohibitin superfamily)